MQFIIGPKIQATNRSNPKKILIISPAWVGDIIIAQSLFKYLKRCCFASTIDIIAPRWSHELLASMPEINAVLDMPLGHAQFQLKQRWRLGKALRKNAYQHAIILPNSWKSAIIPFAARIPLRSGWLGEHRFGLLNDWKSLNKKKLPFMVQRFLALGSSPISNQTISWHSYQPSLVIDTEQRKRTLNELSLELSDKPLLILCPGATFGPTKCWPAEYFAEIAKQKQIEGWHVCLLGSQQDRAAAHLIQKLTAHTCLDLIGKTSLIQAVHILSCATLVISNDSGLMHCAAALQRPLIALYGSSSPDFTPPLTNKKRILSLKLSCSPCFKRECPLVHFNCLKQLKPKQVLLAIEELMTSNS